MPTRGSKAQRRHCCAARKTKPLSPGCAIGTRGGCWGGGGCRNIEELARSGESMALPKLKASKVSQFWKKYAVECKPGRNVTKPQTRRGTVNQTAANRVSPKPSIFNRDNVKTITANHLNPWFLETVTICTEQKKCTVKSPGKKTTLHGGLLNREKGTKET